MQELCMKQHAGCQPSGRSQIIPGTCESTLKFERYAMFQITIKLQVET